MSDETRIDEAREMAARCWCNEATKSIEVNADLADWGITEGLLRTDPAAAMTMAITKGKEDYVVGKPFEHWLERDRAGALAWMHGIADSSQRRRLESRRRNTRRRQGRSAPEPREH